MFGTCNIAGLDCIMGADVIIIDDPSRYLRASQVEKALATACTLDVYPGWGGEGDVSTVELVSTISVTAERMAGIVAGIGRFYGATSIFVHGHANGFWCRETDSVPFTVSMRIGSDKYTAEGVTANA